MTTCQKVKHFVLWCALKLKIEPHELRAMFQFNEGLDGAGLLNEEQIKEYLTIRQIEYAKKIYQKHIEKDNQ